MALTDTSFPQNDLDLDRKIPRRILADYAECRRIMHASSKNYAIASLFLPKDKLPHVEALYALLRVGDDRVDVSHAGFSTPLAAIEDWRDSFIQASKSGDSHYPVLRAYIHTAHQFNIPESLMLPYFQAMIDDLTITRFPQYDDLVSYMEGSAMVVGRVICHIFGTTTPVVSDAYPFADSLSVAMQLTNFWRDIGEDWLKGRIYIPLEDMQQFSYTEKDLANHMIDQRLIDLLEFEFARTNLLYAHARSGIDRLVRGQWGVSNSLVIYQTIMDQIRHNHYNVFTARASVPAWKKAWLIARGWWQVYGSHLL